VASLTGNPSAEGTLRSLNVARPEGGDLLADSTPIWSGHLPWTGSLTSCFALITWPLQISADGKTVSCGQSDGPRIAFVTDPLTAGATATSAIDYQLKVSLGTGVVGVLWTSPSGGTLIGVWGASSSPLGHAIPLSFGVISHGTFTPLRLPSSLTSTFQSGLPFPIAFYGRPHAGRGLRRRPVTHFLFVTASHDQRFSDHLPGWGFGELFTTILVETRDALPGRCEGFEEPV
jgi:hypothetical protein